MILIVAHHYAGKGALSESLVFSSNKYIVDFLLFGGKLGVNCYFLISGYFMCKSKITVRKILKIASEVWFYSLVMLILFNTILVPTETIGGKTILQSLLPITYNAYWFATTYIVLMLVSPFLNRFIQSMDKDMHKKLLVVCTTLFCILSSLIRAKFGVNDLIFCINLYFVAAYIRKYVDINKLNVKMHLTGLCIATFLVFLSIFIFDFIGSNFHIQFLLDHSTYFTNSYSILLFIMGVELFLLSLRGNKSNVIINKISSATFGVYLIHENNILRPYIWKTLFDCKVAYYSDYLLLHAFCAISTVFCVCIGIELIRQRTMGRVVDKVIDCIILKLQSDKYKFLNRFV